MHPAERVCAKLQFTKPHQDLQTVIMPNKYGYFKLSRFIAFHQRPR